MTRALAMLCALCLAESLAVLAISHDVAVSGPAIQATLLTAPIALPYSLTLLFTGAFPQGSILLTTLLPWYTVLGTCLILAFRTRRAVFFLLICILMLLSSWNWSLMSIGLMGV